MREFLEYLGLEVYLPLFEANEIDLASLASITNNDLKEMGIDSLGHRKKILAACGAAPAENRAANPSTERVFLDRRVTVVNGSVASVRITSHRAILGAKTYSLLNIAAVEAFSNESDVEAKYQAALKVREQFATFMRIFAALVFLLASAYYHDHPDEGPPADAFFVALFLFGISFVKLSQPERERVTWSVRLQSAGTSDDVIQCFDEGEIRAVVAALDAAIVNLRV